MNWDEIGKEEKWALFKAGYCPLWMAILIAVVIFFIVLFIFSP